MNTEDGRKSVLCDFCDKSLAEVRTMSERIDGVKTVRICNECVSVAVVQMLRTQKPHFSPVKIPPEKRSARLSHITANPVPCDDAKTAYAAIKYLKKDQEAPMSSAWLRMKVTDPEVKLDALERFARALGIVIWPRGPSLAHTRFVLVQQINRVLRALDSQPRVR